MNATLHRTAHNRAKTPRAGAFAQLSGGGAPLIADAPVARLRTVFRKDFGLLTADFANRPLSEVRCLLPHLKQTARKGNTRKENNNMRKQTWKAAVSAAAIAATAMLSTPSLAVAKETTLALAGYTGTTTLTNFQALVKLNEGRFGFSYDDYASRMNLTLGTPRAIPSYGCACLKCLEPTQRS